MQRNGKPKRRPLIDPSEPRVDMGPRPPAGEDEMLARLERNWGRRWSETANDTNRLPTTYGGGNGRVSHKKNEY